MEKLLHKNQNFKSSSTTLFALLSVEPAYILNWEVLDNNLTSLQETLHPDRYPNGSQEREIADSMLSSINNAYAILKNPIQRAQALFMLKMMHIPGEDGQTISNLEMMEEALSLKESLDEASIKGDFHMLLETLEAQKILLEEQFSTAFLNNNETGMNNTYIRLSFCIKTLNDAKDLCFAKMERLNATSNN